jgi:phage terminase large subunit-like protein
VFELTSRQLEVEEMLRGPQRHSLLVGGSRSGKTFELVSEVCMRAMAAPESRHAILRMHLIDVRQSIGMDTLPKVMKLRFAGQGYSYNRSDQYVSFENKTMPKPPASEGFGIWLAGLDDKERVEKVLGKEMVTLYFNECSQIPYYSVNMALTRLAQNVGYTVQGQQFVMRNRALYDLNPVGTGHWSYRQFIEGKDPESFAPLEHPEDYKFCYMNPGDNAVNLDPKYIPSLMALPERMRRRFFEGRYVAEVDGALWTIEMIERNSIGHEVDPHSTWQDVATDLGLPEMRRVVVAVDPSGAASQFDLRADEIGIVVAGIGVDDHCYVFEDLTGLNSPEQWGSITCNAFWRHRADMVVAEQNFGGDMVRAIIQAHLHPVTKRPVGSNVPVSLVVSSRGKSVRAEPIAAMYERGRVHHVGRFPRLEDEMTNFTTAGYMGARSPNRADSLVFALTELFGSSLSFGLNEYYGAVAGELAAQKEAHMNRDLRAAVEKVEKVDQAAEIAKIDVAPANGKNPTAKCGKCGSLCIQRIPGGQTRCGACGYQWGAKSEAEMTVPTRANV